MKKRNISILSSIFLLLFLMGMILSCDQRTKHQGEDLQSKTNSPPAITSIAISPNQPNKESELSLFVQSHNPKGNPLTYRYQWIENEEEIPGENAGSLKCGNLRKGDLIQVKVIPSDGESFLSGPVKISNTPPVVEEVHIDPKLSYVNSGLKAVVKSFDLDGDFVFYTYQWQKNGMVMPEEKGEVLEKGRFKKGDSITVTVTPDDHEASGKSKKSEAITIVNSPPVIVSSPPTYLSRNIYTYQVKAEDPDNDPIIFALITMPKGMVIDKETGLIKWEVSKENQGGNPIEIEVTDPEGAKSFQRYTLTIEVR